MKKLGLTRKKMVFYIITLLIVVIGDQLTKMIIDHTMQLNSGYTFIENFFYFTYSHNSGAAWGIFQGHLWLFYIISVFAAVAIVYYFYQTQPYQEFTRFGLILVFSGMLGNLIDRICLGYVRDFIDFIILGYDFPIFNIADIAITVGVLFVIYDVCVEEYKAWKLSKLQ